MAAANRDVTVWRKSTYSGASGGDCVEIGGARTAILVRDTKNRDGATLAVESDSWQRLTSALKPASD